MVDAGEFRRDLYFGSIASSFICQLPGTPESIPAMVHAFLGEMGHKLASRCTQSHLKS